MMRLNNVTAPIKHATISPEFRQAEARTPIVAHLNA
jgi:hypothetical protein